MMPTLIMWLPVSDAHVLTGCQVCGGPKKRQSRTFCSTICRGAAKTFAASLRQCSVELCDQPYKGHGLCDKHKSYVEAYEHRVVMGLPDHALEIHHVNGVKTDNRRENLVALSKSDHAILHGITDTRKSRERLPLSEYPTCVQAGCDRPAQCTKRTLCLMHYKRFQRAK
jgi:hypothetical protein